MAGDGGARWVLRGPLVGGGCISDACRGMFLAGSSLMLLWSDRPSCSRGPAARLTVSSDHTPRTPPAAWPDSVCHLCCPALLTHHPVCMPHPGLITPSDYVRVTSTAAAQIYNIYPRKGRIAAGSDADVILLDPAVNHTISAATHHSRLDTNVYEGEQVDALLEPGLPRRGYLEGRCCN